MKSTSPPLPSRPSAASDLRGLGAWVGRTESRTDLLGAAPLAGWSALLDRAEDPPPAAGSVLPPLAHWLYFLPTAAQRELGPDGHPRRGGFLPPVPLPRRMWAGGRLSWRRELLVGETAERRSTIVAVDAKDGRSGPLVFVTVRHEIADARGVALTEEHDIVYRDDPSPGAAPPATVAAPTDEAFARSIMPDPVLLFRYSALTFNGHRIHYDRPYATGVEGYPGLVVHGPLIATLLVDLVRRTSPELRLHGFAFRAASPLFDLQDFDVCGKSRADDRIDLWARARDGTLAMRAEAEVG